MKKALMRSVERKESGVRSQESGCGDRTREFSCSLFASFVRRALAVLIAFLFISLTVGIPGGQAGLIAFAHSADSSDDQFSDVNVADWFATQDRDSGSRQRAAALNTQIPAESIFQRSANAVFMLETFDISGASIRTASGFFVSETGLAITNLHIIENAASATITLYNGDIYPVRGVHAMSDECNLMVISIDSEENHWDYLTLADSDLVETGNSIYAIGSPLRQINTMSAGIVSNTTREIEDSTLIQFTAPISFGSGGSPLLNTLGQVIGVASSSFSYGQNLNLAVPINYIRTLQPGECVTLSSLLT